MHTSMVNIKTADGSCDSYIAYPEGQGQRLPLVILYMDAVGIRPQIYSMANHLADQGYFVVAPNIFYRSKHAPIVDYDSLLKPEKLPELFKQVMGMATQLTPEMARSDMESLIQYVKAQSQIKVDVDHIGLVGYCMGGGIAIRNSAYFPEQVKAVAGFHAGRLATDQPTSPHLLAKDIKASLYVAHADNDQSMPLDQIAGFEKAMTAAGVRFRSELYKGSIHGFTMKDLPAYSEEADARHWKNLLELFAAELKKA